MSQSFCFITLWYCCVYTDNLNEYTQVNRHWNTFTSNRQKFENVDFWPNAMRPLLFTVDYSIETVVRLQIGVKNKIAAYIGIKRKMCYWRCFMARAFKRGDISSIKRAQWWVCVAGGCNSIDIYGVAAASSTLYPYYIDAWIDLAAHLYRPSFFSALIVYTQELYLLGPYLRNDWFIREK